MKLASKTKPRLVLYFTPHELRTIKSLADKAGLKTPHQWARAAVMRALVQA